MYLLLLIVLAFPSLLWAAPGDIGDITIRPAPAPLLLPSKGNIFSDPTYGTRIMRVTDRTDGNNAYHQYSIWSPFNCDATRFFLLIDTAYKLYAFDPVNFTSTKGPTITSGSVGALNYETARWHPTNPDILYALQTSQSSRKVYTLNVSTMVATLFKDFTASVPTGGYGNSFTMSEDGQALGFYSSTTGGQDTGDHVVAYDLGTATTYVLDFRAITGLSNIHSVFLDKSGTYAIIHAGTSTTDLPVYWIWTFRTGALETLYWNASDSPGGHWTIGNAVTYNSSWVGGSLVTRSLATPHTNAVAVEFPSKGGVINFQLDSHRSWVNTDSRFFFNTNQINSIVTGWTLHSGSIYKKLNYRTTNPYNQIAPEGVYADGVALTNSVVLPTAAGQWYYDATGNGTLYVWLPADKAASSAFMIGFAWWPIMEEIAQIWVDEPSNLTKIRRLAHHQSHFSSASKSYSESPKASTSRSGQYVMFDSNWGGSGHVDAFIIQVTDPGPPVPPTPSAPVVTISSGQVGARLLWTPSTDATVIGYTVFRGTTSGVYTSQVDTRTLAQSEALHTSPTKYFTFLPYAGTFYFCVSAITSDGGLSACSNEVSATITGVVRRPLTQPRIGAP